MSGVQTKFGSLKDYEKGGVEVVNDDPRHYVFSNVFEVASKSKPYEKVAVAQNLKYVVEVIRAEGTSPWYASAHDEAAHRPGLAQALDQMRRDFRVNRLELAPGDAVAQDALEGAQRGRPTGMHPRAQRRRQQRGLAGEQADLGAPALGFLH